MGSKQTCHPRFNRTWRHAITRLGLVVAWIGMAWPAAADMLRGGELYRTHCETCHGTNGVPTVPGVPNFARGEGLLQPDAHIHAVIVSGKNACPGAGGMLSDVETLDLLSYLRTLH